MTNDLILKFAKQPSGYTSPSPSSQVTGCYYGEVMVEDYLNFVCDETGVIRRELFEEKDYNQNTKIVEGKEIREPLTIVAQEMEQEFTVARFKQAKIIGKEKLNLTMALKQLENKQEHHLVVRVFTAQNLDHSLINRLATAIDNGTISS